MASLALQEVKPGGEDLAGAPEGGACPSPTRRPGEAGAKAG